MAKVSKSRNQANTGVVIKIELLDEEITNKTALQIGHDALVALRTSLQKMAAKDSADERIAAAQADKAAEVDL